jgi:hypothetical protein
MIEIKKLKRIKNIKEKWLKYISKLAPHYIKIDTGE